MEADADHESLADTMQQLSDEIRSEYVLGYRPARLTRDNKFHSVRVKVSRPSQLRHISWLWRRGYYDRSGF